MVWNIAMIGNFLGLGGRRAGRRPRPAIPLAVLCLLAVLMPVSAWAQRPTRTPFPTDPPKPTRTSVNPFATDTPTPLRNTATPTRTRPGGGATSTPDQGEHTATPTELFQFPSSTPTR